MSHRTLLLAIITALFADTFVGPHSGAGLLWDGANALGFVAAAVLAFLFFETGAARRRPAPQAAFFARLHRDLAALCLILVVLHAGGLLWDDPVTLEYWKISAPLYMLAGILALVLLALSVVSAYRKPRLRLFPDANRFRLVHGSIALLVGVLVVWHVAGSGFYLNTAPQRWLFGIGLGLLPAWLLWRRNGPRTMLRVEPLAPAQAAVQTRQIACAAVLIAVLFAVARNLP